MVETSTQSVNPAIGGAPNPLRARAIAKWVRIAPRKMRLVADMVRGRSVAESLDLLNFTVKRAAVPVRKAIYSAFANLRQTDEGAKLEPEQVFVSEIRVDEGPMLKRWSPRALGRAYLVRHRLSHLTVVLSTQIPSTVKGKMLKRTVKQLKTFTGPTRQRRSAGGRKGSASSSPKTSTPTKQE